MRRFFISNLERLLTILTMLAGLALLAWAVMLARQAQGDPVQLLMAATIFLGGLLAIVAVAGCVSLALAIHDHTRRIAALLERPAASTLRANRKPNAPRPARDHAPVRESIAPQPEPAPRPIANDPRPEPANRPVFSRPAMPKAPKQPEPVLRRATPEPVITAAPLENPSQNPLTSRAPRLVADKRLPH